MYLTTNDWAKVFLIIKRQGDIKPTFYSISTLFFEKKLNEVFPKLQKCNLNLIKQESAIFYPDKTLNH